MGSTPEQPDHAAHRMKSTTSTTSTTSKRSTRLMVLSSAAVVAVYGAGFWKTKAAADRLDAAEAARRSGDPAGRAGGPGSAGPGRETPPPTPTVASQPAALSTPNVTFTLPTRPAPAPPERAAAAVTDPEQVVRGARLQSRVDETARGTEVPRYVQSATSPAAAPAASVNASVTADPAARLLEPATPAAPTPSPAPPPTAATNTLAAAAPAEAQQPAAPALPKPSVQYKDGEYLGWGNCRHGDIQAKVVISAGRITSATIAQCWTRYSCNWIDPVVPQVVQRQSPNIDYVSGATQSVDAFYWAVIDALNKAK